jgi:hypothetical protein
MSSKYDVYWERLNDKIRASIERSIASRKIIILDVHDISLHGVRNNWVGSVDVSPDGISGGEMAHAQSLGQVILNSGMMTQFEGKTIRFKITNRFKLEISTREYSRPYSNSDLVPVDLKNVDIENTNILAKMNFEEIYEYLKENEIFSYNYNKDKLPMNGIYFFYEDNETCIINGQKVKRIVRVGTHRAEARFRDRIHNHFYGNKECSIFRKHVGSAIIKNKGFHDIDIDEWMKKGTETNIDIELLIDEKFRKTFTFKCISIETKELRLSLEKRLIKVLSLGGPGPWPNWLGNDAANEKVRESGLWNVDHVQDRL